MEKKVLIVTDDSLLDFGISRVLEKYNPLIKSACGWTEALSDMSACFYTLCFLDLDIQDTDGLEVLKKMRETSPGTKIAAMASFSPEEKMKQEIENNAYMFLNKPFDLLQVKL
ncbi:MAG: response regulator, partial [Syntrophales bacterium LBB04]|nr:response regulator [Syntrophales bacterium LBB04]